MTHPFRYFAYGLYIETDIPLPTLPQRDRDEASPVDIRITVGETKKHSSLEYGNTSGVAGAFQDFHLGFEAVGVFHIREGRDVLIQPDDGVDEEWIGMVLLGRILPCVLMQRGFLLLHASAVSSNDGVIAFIGNSGWGKSTLAGALVERGWRLATDDVLALDFPDADKPPMVSPSFPLLKLWPNSIEALGEKPESLPRLTSDYEKRGRIIEEDFSRDPLPLRRLYVINEAETIAIEPFKGTEALLELVRHGFVTLLIPRLKDSKDTQARHFRNTARLVDMVSVRRLNRPRDLSLLGQLVDLIEVDIKR